MEKYADLEIGLHRRDRDIGQYQIELRFNPPGDDVDKWLVHDDLRFDIERLRTLMLDDTEYGKLLGENLLGIQDVGNFFNEVRALTQFQQKSLRVRLFISQSAAQELHSLRWETLHDPQTGDSLLTSEHLFFSRYLYSSDWRRVRPRPRTDLRALVVIANPSDASTYQLASLNVEEELKRVKTSLGDIPVTELSSGGKATLKNIITHLRDGYDIMYLIGHGSLVKNKPWLFLEEEDGTTARVAGSELVTRLRELIQQPRLIVLASCQSAGSGDEPRTGDEGVLAALGPRLAEAGIPAVIAMQGNITIKTIETSMPVFFQELQKDGQIDRAMAIARGTVREHSDWWMPVLFMRLKSGRIWYAPGFTQVEGSLKTWPALVSSINNERCTPILGPELSESLLGSHREIARRWAKTYHFPMSPHNQEELPHVAQYLAIHQKSTFFPRDSLIEYVRNELARCYKNDLPDILAEPSLEELLSLIGTQHRKRNPGDPYRILAELPFPIYINTNPGNLLEDALVEAGKDPKVELCRWNEDIESPFVSDDEVDYEPNENQPLVYYLFGSLRDPDSLVLTEDDYFDYLIGVSRNQELIPTVIGGALTNRALLFLGFQMDDWDFRVLFRSITAGWEGKRRKKLPHVAAQITPEEGRVLDSEQARRYLDEYFQDISIYWGSTKDFVQELQQQWKGGTR